MSKKKKYSKKEMEQFEKEIIRDINHHIEIINVYKRWNHDLWNLLRETIKQNEED